MSRSGIQHVKLINNNTVEDEEEDEEEEKESLQADSMKKVNQVNKGRQTERGEAAAIRYEKGGEE